MTANKPDDAAVDACPNCGGDVVYGGVGRRPVWCSTRCRNDASLKRLGARKAAVEVRVVDVVHRTTLATSESAPASDPAVTAQLAKDQRATTPSAEQALRVVRQDSEAVGALISYLYRRQVVGELAGPRWLPVRNAIRLMAAELGPHLEAPSGAPPTERPETDAR